MTKSVDPWRPTDLVVFEKSCSTPVVGQIVFPPPKEVDIRAPLPEMIVKLSPRPHPAWRKVRVTAAAHPAGNPDAAKSTMLNSNGVEVDGEDGLFFVFRDIFLPQTGDCGLFFSVYVDGFDDARGNTDALTVLGPTAAKWKNVHGYLLGAIEVPLVKGRRGFLSASEVAAHTRQTELTPEGARKWDYTDFSRIKAIMDAQEKLRHLKWWMEISNPILKLLNWGVIGEGRNNRVKLELEPDSARTNGVWYEQEKQENERPGLVSFGLSA
ncbi:hypothetical protein B0T20DRAFT_395922 [Sordaria brevicollis]|uniref:Uncharacterized protein n=1 Tax=Sordaria brevicollis TaxID=83679 RepID=A0AAE0P318_SORBR|nr:hypothetical protein B0T20DRAFT_395922 [Sordaria brevicollis]